MQVQTDGLVYKVSGASKLVGVLGGDWDLNRTLCSHTAKHRSMVQRYVHDWPWEATELFVDVFPRRFDTGLAFRGSFDLRAVAAYYYEKVDHIFLSLKKVGFLPRNPPHVLIGRSGEIMLGNQGNHRVAMAKIIGIKEIPCSVVCRHSETLND